MGEKAIKKEAGSHDPFYRALLSNLSLAPGSPADGGEKVKVDYIRSFILVRDS